MQAVPEGPALGVSQILLLAVPVICRCSRPNMPDRQQRCPWLNRIEAQFTALRYFALDGTDHATHKEQASMIRRYIIWRNNHAYDERLRHIVTRANVA
jgi:hypothetical protein